MLYLGYPVELAEAHRICNQPFPEEYDYGESLSEFLKKADIDIFYLDDGVCLIGRELKQFALQSDFYFPANLATDVIQQEKQIIANAIQALHINLSVVQLSRPGTDSQIVRNPEPFLLFY